MTRSMYTVPVRYPAGLLIAVVVVAFAVGLARRAEADGEFLRLLHCEEFFHRATDWWATDAKPKGFRHRFDVNRCFVESPTGTHEAAGHAFTPISTSFDVATSVASERIPVQASSSMYPFPTTYTRYVIETKAKCAADPWQFPAVRSACTRLSARWGYGWDSAPTKPLFLAAAVVLPVSAAGGGPAVRQAAIDAMASNPPPPPKPVIAKVRVLSQNYESVAVGDEIYDRSAVVEVVLSYQRDGYYHASYYSYPAGSQNIELRWHRQTPSVKTYHETTTRIANPGETTPPGGLWHNTPLVQLGDGVWCLQARHAVAGWSWSDCHKHRFGEPIDYDKPTVTILEPKSISQVPFYQVGPVAFQVRYTSSHPKASQSANMPPAPPSGPTGETRTQAQVVLQHDPSGTGQWGDPWFQIRTLNTTWTLNMVPGKYRMRARLFRASDVKKDYPWTESWLEFRVGKPPFVHDLAKVASQTVSQHAEVAANPRPAAPLDPVKARLRTDLAKLAHSVQNLQPDGRARQLLQRVHALQAQLDRADVDRSTLQRLRRETEDLGRQTAQLQRARGD